VSLWHETLIIDGAKADPDIIDAIPKGGAILRSTMEGAESLELTVSDPDMKFLRSGALTRKGKPSTRQQDLKLAAWQRFAAMRLNLDGVWFRFAGAQGNYDAQPWSITLTFESELATLMRLVDDPFKWSRGKGTRLGFIHNLAVRAQNRDLSDRGILTFTTYSPDPFAKEDVAKVKDPDRKKGLSSSAHLTIKGNAINAEQRRNLTISLTEAEKQNANERVFLAMIVAGIGESQFQVIPNSAGSDYGGVFQGKFKGTNPQFAIGDTKGMAHYFLAGGKGFQAGGAIKLAASNAALTPGAIAYKVEGSRSNFISDDAAEAFYQQNINEAKTILEAWGGASTTYTVVESFEFRAGEKDPTTGRRENYWDASGRLVDDRRWRRFASRNALWLGPDSWFFKNRPTYVIDGNKNFASQGVLGMTFSADIGMPLSEVKIRAIAPRWTAAAGTVWHFDAPEMPIDGRWLIWDNELDLTQSVEVAGITLRRPAPAKKEPAPTTRTRSETAPETGTARDRIVKAAKKALGKQPHYAYEQSRPMHKGLFDFPKVTRRDVDGSTAQRTASCASTARSSSRSSTRRPASATRTAAATTAPATRAPSSPTASAPTTRSPATSCFYGSGRSVRPRRRLHRRRPGDRDGRQPRAR
jgi:hypothetical protein